MQKTITLGRLTLSIQSFIVAIIGLVVSLITLSLKSPWASAMILLGFFAAAYNVNCVVVGQCIEWAWALVGLYGLYVVLLVGALAIGSRATTPSNVFGKRF